MIDEIFPRLVDLLYYKNVKLENFYFFIIFIYSNY